VTGGVPDLRLVCDVGGTRTRFALADGEGHLKGLQEFETRDFANFTDAAKAYLARRDAVLSYPTAAAVAIAGPVVRDVAELTNAAWRIAPAEAVAALGLDALRLVNDFEAQTYALPWLGPNDLEQIGGGAAREGTNRVVLGPGTGLGAAALVGDRTGRRLAVSGEAGHTTLPAASDEEAALIARLRRRFGHVSAERALCGPGLETLYQVLDETHHGLEDGAGRRPAAAELAALAAAGDETARAALAFFSAFLGTVAADLALTFWASGGVYISGGVIPRLGQAFDRSAFRQRFESKGRFRRDLATFPTYLVTHPNLGLFGLAMLEM